MVFCSLLVTLFGAPARITGPLGSTRLVVRAPSIWPTLTVSPTMANTIAQRRLRTTTLRCVVRPAVYMEWLIARPCHAGPRGARLLPPRRPAAPATSRRRDQRAAGNWGKATLWRQAAHGDR